MAKTVGNLLSFGRGYRRAVFPLEGSTARGHLMSLQSGFQASLSPGEVYALLAYRDGETLELNRKLRAGRPLDDDETNRMLFLQGALAKTPLLDRPIKAYGSLRVSGTEGPQTGTVIEAPSFLGLTLSADVIQDRARGRSGVVFFEVTIPTGVKALYLDDVTAIGDQELLFGPGSQLKVVGEVKRGSRTFLQTEMVRRRSGI